MTASEERSDDRIEVDWLRAIAGALAAVVSAVLLSTLGEVGTLLGAALGSLILTIGSALFARNPFQPAHAGQGADEREAEGRYRPCRSARGRAHRRRPGSRQPPRPCRRTARRGAAGAG